MLPSEHYRPLAKSAFIIVGHDCINTYNLKVGHRGGMYADITKPPAPLPRAQFTKLRPGLSLLLPLSRRGYGPGLVILVSDSSPQLPSGEGVLSPTWKWAEEGYTVVEVQVAFMETSKDALSQAVDVLMSCDSCLPKEKLGLIGRVLVILSLPGS